MALDVVTAHELRLHRTNHGGVVYVCTCGESGNVHKAPQLHDRNGKARGRDWDFAERNATAEWHTHADLFRQIERDLKIERAKAIVHRPGRLGNG